MLFTRSLCLPGRRLYGRVLSREHRRPATVLGRACLPASRLSGGREASVEVRRDELDSNYRPATKPDFQNAKVIYDKRSFSELLRSYVVFSLCSVDVFVDHQAKILALLRRLLGRRLFIAVMKKTIFGQFMATEDSEAVLRLAKRHSQSGVTPLFAYTAAEFHGGHSGASAKSSRDVWCQGNFNAIASSIEMANKCKEFTNDQPVVTTKLTFLTDYSDLRSLTEVINQQTKLIERCLIEKGNSSVGNYRSLIDYLSQVTRSASDDEFASMTPCVKVDNKATRLSQYQLVGLLSSACFHVALNRFIQKNPMPWVRDSESNVIRLGEEDLQRISRLWSRMSELNKMASERKTVVINYDAEQTFIQPAIEALVLDSKRVFNKQRPIVLNTYQCYLKRTLGILKRDLELCREEGFCFGGKVVRGAYMDEERRLAKQHNYPDPVNDSYEITTDVYCKAIESILADAADPPSSSSSSSSSEQLVKPMRVIVATHNVDTVNFVIERLRDKKLDARKSGISFAQLLGTRDYISFALGAAGYPAGKLIHYAEPESGLAYLSRRLQENRSGLPSPAIERRLLMDEIKRRFLRRP